MDMLGKLTLKDIGCDGAMAAALPKVGDRVALARIYGVATGTKTKEDKRTSTFHTSIVGNFRAKNLQEGSDNFGKTFGSGVLFLPSGLQEMIESQVSDGDAEVTFALDVFAYKVDRPGAKYSYGGVVLGEPAKEDPLSRLEAQFTDVPALNAPKEEPKQEPEAKGGKHKEAENA